MRIAVTTGEPAGIGPEISVAALDALAKVVEDGGNVFGELINTVEHCSLGQITGRLQEVVGRYRPMV